MLFKKYEQMKNMSNSVKRYSSSYLYRSSSLKKEEYMW